MKTASVVLGLVAVVVTVIVFLLPRHGSIMYFTSTGAGIAVSRERVSLIPAPDHYAVNGFDHVEKYVMRMLGPTQGTRFLSIFTPDGYRGFGLDSRNGVLSASLTVEWRRDPQRESSIRAFFASLGITPSRDYLAGNGGVPDATRILEYPLTGSVSEISALTKRILAELCAVNHSEALNFRYSVERDG